MKHTRKILAAVALFGLAPLVGCDQNGVEDASRPDGARTPDTTRTPDATRTPDRQPPAADRPRDPAPPAGVDDPERQIDDPATGG